MAKIMNKNPLNLEETARRMRENRLIINPQRLFTRMGIVTFALIGLIFWPGYSSNPTQILAMLGIYYVLEFLKLMLYRKVRQRTMAPLDSVKVDKTNK